MDIPLAITIGDINGIGPEIILKALTKTEAHQSTPVVISPETVIRFYAKTMALPTDLNFCTSADQIVPYQINVLDIWGRDVQPSPGKQSAFSGKIAMQSIEHALELTKAGITKAMVTAPISKEAVNLAGYSIPGHTEFLAKECQVESVLMMLVSNNLRVALVTTHVPVAKITTHVTEKAILEKLQLLNHSLKYDFRIPSPKIAVLGLNPHAGDGGVIGQEEIELIEPALKHAKKIGIDVSGPYPADGFFGQQTYKKVDAVLSMYHDQGLAPFKALSFGTGVNFTAGLPIIRTSPDHGTAFDIAGKNQADPSSFIEAYHLAEELTGRSYARSKC